MIKAGQGCTADPAKVECLLDMEAPGTILLVQSFLGAAGYLSKYISDYVELVLPLREMDDGRPKYTDISSEWSVCRLRALDALKTALTTAPVLAAPDFSKPWTILTDCSDYAMGACLAQLDENGTERPMAYMPVLICLRHKRTTVSSADKEGLAVMWAVRK